MNTKRIISLVASLALVLSLSVGLTGCGDKAAQDDNQGSTDGEGTKYTVGICQLVQHEALDAATQGFIDALNEALPGQVEIVNKNASGDSANCSTIVNGFVSDGVDLIMANATPALQAAQSATNEIPVLGTSVTEYGVAQLRGQTLRERAKRLIAIAHPKFREELAEEFEKRFGEKLKV